MTMERVAPRLTALALAGALVLLGGVLERRRRRRCDVRHVSDRSEKVTAPTGTGPKRPRIVGHGQGGADPIGIARARDRSGWSTRTSTRSEDPSRGSIRRPRRVLATIGVGSVPLEVAVGEGGVWVSNSGDDTVSRIDPSSNEAVADIDVCAAPEGVAVADGSIWVVCEDDGVVARIDPGTDEMVDQVDVGLQPRFVTFAFDDIWVSSYFDGTITRIDPANGKVVAEITTEQGPQIMAEAGGLLWVSCTDVDHVQAIDPATNEVVATVETSVAPDGLAFDGTTLWVATEIGPSSPASTRRRRRSWRPRPSRTTG